MSDFRSHKSPNSAAYRGPLSGREREAVIARLKKDAPGLEKRDNRQISARSMVFAVMAVVGVMVVFYLMNLLDSVGHAPEDENLRRVDFIEPVSPSRTQALIERIEREIADAEAVTAAEMEALRSLEEQLRVDPWEGSRGEETEPGPSPFLPVGETDRRRIEELVPPVEISIDTLDR